MEVQDGDPQKQEPSDYESMRAAYVRRLCGQRNMTPSRPL